MCAVEMQRMFLRCLYGCGSYTHHLVAIRRNFYQPVLVRLCCDCAIIEAWFPLLDM